MNLERGENIILAFCEKLTKAPETPLAKVCLQSLWRLFNNLEQTSPLRYHVYYHLVQVAKQCNQVAEVFSTVDQLKGQFAPCPPSSEQMQKLYRLLHDVLKDTDTELASKVMIELLGTYTAENASVAREDAIKCIASALADPNTFLLDPLLALKPVRFLEGELIHDLLSIFVSEKLAAYVTFYTNHKEFVTSQGLSHEQNLKKMRLLTFMQLAESHPQMSFAELQKELQIGESDVEPFIIEGECGSVCARNRVRSRWLTRFAQSSRPSWCAPAWTRSRAPCTSPARCTARSARPSGSSCTRYSTPGRTTWPSCRRAWRPLPVRSSSWSPSSRS